MSEYLKARGYTPVNDSSVMWAVYAHPIHGQRLRWLEVLEIEGPMAFQALANVAHPEKLGELLAAVAEHASMFHGCGESMYGFADTVKLFEALGYAPPAEGKP